jgi:hypothetical protein
VGGRLGELFKSFVSAMRIAQAGHLGADPHCGYLLLLQLSLPAAFLQSLRIAFCLHPQYQDQVRCAIEYWLDLTTSSGFQIAAARYSGASAEQR